MLAPACSGRARIGGYVERPYVEDPEPGDENDPAYKEELFRTFQEMGWAPEELKDPQDQQEYAEWLKTKPE
jgi:hypothetical protein